jgi:cobalt/nickel transport system permease protein
MATLGIPDKVVQLFLFTYRYIHVIHEEYLRLLRALKIRGFEPGTNLHTYRTYAYLVGMLLLKSYERSFRIRQAMLCRGFQGRFYSLNHLSMKTSDWLMAGSMLLGVAGIAGATWAKILP